MIIKPQWAAPKNIHAFTTTRDEGNLATHVGDNVDAVLKNRKDLIANTNLPRDPVWLTQTHSINVVELNSRSPNPIHEPTDASFTHEAKLACAVLTADCLPLLICNKAGTEVAAIHAGWKGLLAGIIEHTVHHLDSPPPELLIWLGPTIGPLAFEVGDDVRLDFIQRYPQNESAFKKINDRWFGDMTQLAKISLATTNVYNVYGGDYCTVSNPTQFFSARRDQRDGTPVGRMASVIWFT